MEEKSKQDVKWYQLIGSLFSLWWLFAALLGAPPILHIAHAAFTNYDPGRLERALIDGYGVIRDYLEILLLPVEFIFALFSIKLHESYVDVLSLLLVWAAGLGKGFARFGTAASSKTYIISCGVAVFAAFSYGALPRYSGYFGEMLLIVVPMSFVGLSLVVAAAYAMDEPLTARDIVKGVGMVLWAPIGVGLICAFPLFIILKFYAIESGMAAIVTIFQLSYVIFMMSAWDSFKGGDWEASRFYLTLFGPYFIVTLIYVAKLLAYFAGS